MKLKNPMQRRAFQLRRRVEMDKELGMIGKTVKAGDLEPGRRFIFHRNEGPTFYRPLIYEQLDHNVAKHILDVCQNQHCVAARRLTDGMLTIFSKKTLVTALDFDAEWVKNQALKSEYTVNARKMIALEGISRSLESNRIKRLKKEID
jgi:hypothetical protein